jgi:hypothetical protein
MANTEKERLLKELRDDAYYSEPPMFFIGWHPICFLLTYAYK